MQTAIGPRPRGPAARRAHARARRLVAGVLAWMMVALVAAPGHAAPSAKRIRAVRVKRSPVVDGKLDDPAWQEARFASDFVQRQPAWGQPPSRGTEVAIVYDHEALYVGARLHAEGPEDIQAVMTRRDETGTAERLILSFDTFRDRRTAVSFAVTAAGVRADWYHTDDFEFSRDYSFNPVWTARTAIGPTGWTAEIRIPFTQMRFADGRGQAWGINVNRYVPHRNEDIYWVAVPRGESAWASYFGEIEGLEDVRQPLRLEVVPYATADVTARSKALVADDPFLRETEIGGDAGLDVKLGLGPSLTLDMTVNPDFGQVEADPATVNLGAYETIFAERRPFFTEGSNLFTGNGLQFYYSRRIGAPPRGSVEIEEDRDGDGASDLEDSYVDAPLATRILGAAKLTGRLSSGLSVGALTALTAPARAEHVARYDDGSEQRGRALVDPLTSYNVLRLQQELGATGSYVGSTLTGVARALGDDPLAQAMARQAMTGGVDWLVRLEGGAYLLDGYLGASLLRGEPEAITAIGESSVHYLQRPDQDHVSLDPDATSLSGLAGRVGMSKRTGQWRWNVSSSFETPGFDLNDVGQLQASDDLIWGGNLLRHQSEPGALVHEWLSGMAGEGKWSFSGVREYWAVVGFGEVVWKNFWRTAGELVLVTPGDSDFATRGGPLAGTGWGVDGSFGLNSAAGSRTQWHVGADAEWFETGPRGVGIRGGLTLQPSDRLSVSLTPRYARFSNNRQYIDTIDEPGLQGNPETYGARYVFGTIDLRELAVQARVQVVLSPELALDFYAEPFVSSGRFHGFGELPRPRSRGLAVYGRDRGTIGRDADGDAYDVGVGSDVFGFDDPDFTALSFRSTAVLRWEIWPGSTLFAVWQVNRADDLGAPESVTPLSWPGLWTDAVQSPGAQTVALKLAYWWPVD
jgi:nuclear transport factor 2 (NTF2) superfamily protein